MSAFGTKRTLIPTLNMSALRGLSGHVAAHAMSANDP